MTCITLDGVGALEEWRDAARDLLARAVPPQAVDWRSQREDIDLFAGAESMPDLAAPSFPTVAAPSSGAVGFSVPRGFLTLAETVLCHSDPSRFDLLYRLLWRLRTERALLDDVSDPEVSHALALAKSVRRDAHKMTAFVRFKELPEEEAGSLGARRRFFAWFEPDHYIVARTAPFFERRFNDMDWIIATPKGTAAWNGARLSVTYDSHETVSRLSLKDDADALWRTYFRNIFNPARLKIKAMQAEMPKKYWKNLPEAELIPELISSAEARVRDMAARAPTHPPAFHAGASRKARENVTEGDRPPEGTIEALRAAAAGCTRCPLHCNATQTVFGEGPEDARVMVVGEQPGDQEDLAGRPFIGPAGRMFDRIAEEAGLERDGLYVTNAVKHFKYEPRGKRRLHKTPNTGEIRQCRWWLTGELAIVKPKLVVAMGATALTSVMNHAEKLGDYRGRFTDLGEGQRLYTTVHPSYLLRLPDETRRQEEIARFREDLTAVKEAQARL
ncbi:uracil-DNA glycosylase [Xaviernesmea oryzae]|uniref:Type-4 uracil-DNA glycosylase n=1 Tax=Xaviernesmea oryzae TaxID=464029 RepID=A0A1Q9AYE9_9HYPH|nr:UdgX family uracil-DNA binding protein [Xaviernesmea oryzae]OLP60468.1 uracil-DNA glycosylase [Xaviernesmea oryzae]